MASLPSSFQVELPAELESVAAARHLFRDALEVWGLDEPLCSDGALAISELVSNSVLHAGTDITVRVRRLGSGVRIEVEDGNSRLPVVAAARPEDLLANRSMGGRGLALVAASADRWGADPGASGKVTWAEIGTGRRVVAPAPSPAFPPEPAPPVVPVGVGADGVLRQTALDGAGRRVHLIGIPVQLLIESSSQLWDLQREMQVVAMDHAAASEIGQVVQAGRPWIGDIDLWAQQDRPRLEQVAASGAEFCDYDVVVPFDILDQIKGLTAWVGQATSSALSRYFLTCPASAAVKELRRWIIGEIASQMEGEPPQPCPIRAESPPSSSHPGVGLAAG